MKNTTLIWTKKLKDEKIKKELKLFSKKYFDFEYLNQASLKLNKNVIFLFVKPKETNTKEDGLIWPKTKNHYVLVSKEEIQNEEDFLSKLLKQLAKISENKTLSLESILEELSNYGFTTTSDTIIVKSKSINEHILALLSLMNNNSEYSLTNFLKAIKISEKEKNNKHLKILYHNISIYYSVINQNEEALKYLIKEEKCTKNAKELARLNIRKLKLLLSLKRFNQVINLINKNLEITKKYIEEKELTEVYDNVLSKVHASSHYFHKSNQLDEALTSYIREIKTIKILPLDEETKKIKLSHINMMLASIFMRKKEFTVAEKYYIKSIKLRKELYKTSKEEYSLILEASYEHLIELYKKTNNINKYEQIKKELSSLKENI